jgi:hypothetical protein
MLRAMRPWLTIAALVACGPAHPPATVHPDDPPAAPHDAGAPPALDAGVVIDATPAAAQTSAFTPSAPLPPPGPPTPASARCRSTTDADLEREEQREAAAIDVALRAQGFTPLEVIAGDKQGYASDGSHTLKVGTLRGCQGNPPLVAMTKTHEVFVVVPAFTPAHTRTVTECTGSCRGACGINMPDRDALARVPADAVLGAARDIKVPIDVKVAFKIEKQVRCEVP